MDARRKYRIYLIACAARSVAHGVFGPFFFLFIQQKGGGIENLGIALGILVSAQSITSYFAGHLSDKRGREPVLIAAALCSAVVVIAYIFITTTSQLFLLQGMLGLLDGATGTVGAAFLADVTFESTRGRDIGRFDCIVGLLTALALTLSGYLVAISGYATAFILMAIGDVVYAALLALV